MQQLLLTSICFATIPFAVLGSIIPNYTVWLESPLRVEFNSSNNCINYHLFRQISNTFLNAHPNRPPVDNNNTYFFAFTIPSVSIKFNNVTMTVQAEDSHQQQVYQCFFIYTRGLSCGSPLKHLHI